MVPSAACAAVNAGAVGDQVTPARRHINRADTVRRHTGHSSANVTGAILACYEKRAPRCPMRFGDGPLPPRSTPLPLARVTDAS
jgi:hypothetical protein